MDDDECVDLDGLEEMEEESAPKEKSKGPPIQERKRKNQPQMQLTLFDLMGDTSNQEEKEKEEFIKHELNAVAVLSVVRCEFATSTQKIQR